ncbi:MAG: MoxR family ATPase [Clostridiaceae bacterium]|nr:MoxR family ATPase [Eubacteriales bacterium]
MGSEKEVSDLVLKIKENVARVMVGKEQAADMALIALICGGHILIEDVPGLGKTTLVAALAKTLDCAFRRIQFTPDVLPSDVTGFTSINLKTGEREVNFGAVMAQVVLADEINRTSPKTQSSLLEVMQEGQVTIDGVSYPVPQPFIVLATQNPVELIGTYPLPEAQLDRFLLKISLGYPQREDELDILKRNKGKKPLDEIKSVAGAEDILFLRRKHGEVLCAQPILEYIVAIANATRASEKVLLGASPRGSLALMNAAMAHAMLMGRAYTLPDDVQRMAEPVLAHRLVLHAQGSQRKETPETILSGILRSIKVPGLA